MFERAFCLFLRFFKKHQHKVLVERFAFTLQLNLTKFHLLVSSCVGGLFKWVKNNLKMFVINTKTRTLVHKPVYLTQDLNY